jgi:hypothetical protein
MPPPALISAPSATGMGRALGLRRRRRDGDELGAGLAAHAVKGGERGARCFRRRRARHGRRLQPCCFQQGYLGSAGKAGCVRKAQVGFAVCLRRPVGHLRNAAEAAKGACGHQHPAAP